MGQLTAPSGEVHPVPNGHPAGEWRGWCPKCGGPTWTDDVSFTTYHVGSDGSDTRTSCDPVKG